MPVNSMERSPRDRPPAPTPAVHSGELVYQWPALVQCFGPWGPILAGKNGSSDESRLRELRTSIVLLLLCRPLGKFQVLEVQQRRSARPLQEADLLPCVAIAIDRKHLHSLAVLLKAPTKSDDGFGPMWFNRVCSRSNANCLRRR